ncbi:MAG TPA: SRPBCC family protein [Methylomirabilota bacterium]|nr:SRPBCC family protein [Methylomirabilota bacterium]
MPGRVNVGTLERVASIAGGLGLIAWGLRRRSRAGLGMAMTGASLAWRGLSGWCALYGSLGIDRARGGRGSRDGTRGNLGVKVERELLFEDPPAKLYAFWRDFRNLPSIMSNVRRVTVDPDGRSHWVVNGPAGTTSEWDAEVINDRPGELIAWRTVSGAVAHAGSVHFEPQPTGGTLVRVSLQYDPPGGELTHLVSALFGADPGQRIAEDLQRFKEAMERAGQDRDGLQPATAEALGYPRPDPGRVK